MGDLPKRDRGAVRRIDQNLARDGLRIITEVARIADIDAVALAAFNRCRDHLATQSGANHVLNIVDGQPVAGERGAVGFDVQVIAAKHTLGERAGGAGHVAHDGFDLL